MMEVAGCLKLAAQGPHSGIGACNAPHHASRVPDRSVADLALKTDYCLPPCARSAALTMVHDTSLTDPSIPITDVAPRVDVTMSPSPWSIFTA